MPLLQPSTPLTERQKKVAYSTASCLLVLGLWFGFWEAKECSRIVFGYAAGYNFFAAWVFMGLACALGLLLLIYWRTRWIGIGLIAFGLLSLGTFFAELQYLLKTDQVAWKHEPPARPSGPDHRASVIVYFKHNVTHEQIEAFNEQVLQSDNAGPRHEGKDYPDFFSGYLRLLRSQANGYDAVALTFRENAPQDRVDKYIERIKSDSRVEKIVLNAIPLQVNTASDKAKKQ